MLYFIISGNMQKGRIKQICLTARSEGLASIENAKLVFKGEYTFGWPSIEKCKGSSVNGVLYDIAESDFINIEKQEMFRKDIKKKRATIIKKDGKEVKAVIFVVESEKSRYEMPLKECILGMARGYYDYKIDIGVLEKALEENYKNYYDLTILEQY
jgi:cation transport regulator ChaC